MTEGAHIVMTVWCCPECGHFETGPASQVFVWCAPCMFWRRVLVKLIGAPERVWPPEVLDAIRATAARAVEEMARRPLLPHVVKDDAD